MPCHPQRRRPSDDDPIRSPATSQRLLGTREIAVIHHTDRGNADTSPRTIRVAKATRTGSSRAGPLQA
jgi:hypothetical protein